MSLCLISDKSSRIQSSPKVLFVIMARERQKNPPNCQSNEKSRTTLIICIFFQHTNSGGDLDDAWKNPPATCCLPKIEKNFPFLPFFALFANQFFHGSSGQLSGLIRKQGAFCGPYLTTFSFVMRCHFHHGKSWFISGIVDQSLT